MTHFQEYNLAASLSASEKVAHEGGLLVIGAGLSRTGTLSLRRALETLYKGTVYHGIELLSSGKDHARFWDQLYQTRQGDAPVELIREFFNTRGYIAAVDCPTAYYWRHILEAYPEAKVLVTTRDPIAWRRSMMSTLYLAHENFKKFHMRFYLWLTGQRNMEIANGIVSYPIGRYKEGFLGACIEGDEQAVQFYEDWLANIQNNVPSEQLLIYSVKDGWEPLCRFLDKKVPDEEFPKINDAEQIKGGQEH